MEWILLESIVNIIKSDKKAELEFKDWNLDSRFEWCKNNCIFFRYYYIKNNQK